MSDPAEGHVPARVTRPRKSRARRRRERLSAVAILFLVIGIPVIVFGFGPSILGWYDDGHRIEVVCNVRAAEASISSSRSAKGAGGSEPQVAFNTDCGNLLYLDGIDRTNMKQVASTIDAGEDYRFEVGAGSYNLRSVLGVLKVAPTIYRYAEVRE